MTETPRLRAVRITPVTQRHNVYWEAYCTQCKAMVGGANTKAQALGLSHVCKA